MKNLKLNQLNKQKVTESEMNVIKGGILPGGWEYVPIKCTSSCIDEGNPFGTPNLNNWASLKADFYR